MQRGLFVSFSLDVSIFIPLRSLSSSYRLALMASSSSGNSIPAPEAVQVLVSSLADDFPIVREASAATLKDIASLNPLLVLDCCSTVSRGGRRRFGNMAGLFQVMSVAIRALDKNDVDPQYMAKLAKIAAAEIISPSENNIWNTLTWKVGVLVIHSEQELNADWQRAASSVLVALGLHLPDLMMEEIFLHLSGSNSALPAMVQILSDFASSDGMLRALMKMVWVSDVRFWFLQLINDLISVISEALQFTPRLKGVLTRVLPILGSVKDIHRPVFANEDSSDQGIAQQNGAEVASSLEFFVFVPAFKSWCQACWQYGVDYPLTTAIDGDVILSEAWHAKRPLLVEAVKNLLDESNLAVRKALSELIVVMASHCYLVGSPGELFVEYLVRNCAMTDSDRTDIESSKEYIRPTSSYNPFLHRKSEFVAESLDVIQDVDWVISLGNSFAKQYELYSSDDEHSALLHRCLGILLQKVHDRSYVRAKIDWMYMQANIALPVNRLGLAKAIGLVAASHLDTVLDKLKDILDNVGDSLFKRILSIFSDRAKMEESDDVHAALALMYGYAAKYAPSTVIEARIDALVILDLFFSISLSLPRSANSSSGLDIESCYGALSALEDVIAILRSDASLDPSEVFNRIVSSVCILFTKNELVSALHVCSTAICDKIRQSAEGSIQAVTEFITKRGRELNEADISRTTQSLLSAAVHVTEKYLRQETLNAVPMICLILCKSLDRPTRHLREAAAAVLSEFVRFSDSFGSLLEQMVEGLCRHVSDDSPTVRRLCLRGLVQMPPVHVLQYTTQILSVIVALLDDPDESVQLTAVSCLLTVLASASTVAVEPILLNLSVRLRNLQVFGMLIGKISRSSDAIVRATGSLALGLLLKSPNSSSWKVARLEPTDSILTGREMESSRRS
ncbi:UNVERIFIED_CONTAM: protein SHOOT GRAVITROPISM 6 [Sesamum calycinum]|uniref:Protein SHOOT GRAVITROPISM 6 n=1 Tax=Sesamum calycinum TaxID=2727403 RepID=A0AAW2MYZ3_9LAMI